MLTRSFLPPSQRSSILAYSPMLHARLFAESQKYRDQHFEPIRPASSSEADGPPPEPYLDGNPQIDRPLFVQFCANDPAALLSAAQLVAPHCNAVDLNLGCPQGIARKGHYGAFLQEKQDLIYNLIRSLHENLPIPVTVKIRILDTKEATLAYAQNVLKAGASILTVHGRRREQKGHLTGLADWEMIQYLRDNLPPETVLFANGNILQPGDLERCLEATGADGVMSAEGNLSDPGIFGPVPEVGQEGREYWRGKDGWGGWRVDAVVRRYFDILHQYALGAEPPTRRPLFMPGDDTEWLKAGDGAESDGPPRKKRRKDGDKKANRLESPNLIGVRPHLFHLLRHFVAKHHDVRDALARSNAADMENLEGILDKIERKVAQGLLDYERLGGESAEEAKTTASPQQQDGQETAAAIKEDAEAGMESSVETVRKCRRPWWVTQPIVRPLPKEAMAKGAIRMSKKDKQKISDAQGQNAGPQSSENGAAAHETAGSVAASSG